MFQINFSNSFHQRKDKTFIIAQQQRKRKAVNEIFEIFNAEFGKSWFYLFFSHSQETKKIILFATKKGIWAFSFLHWVIFNLNRGFCINFLKQLTQFGGMRWDSVCALEDKHNAVLRYSNIFHWMKISNLKQILIASTKIYQQLLLFMCCYFFCSSFYGETPKKERRWWDAFEILNAELSSVWHTSNVTNGNA